MGGKTAHKILRHFAGVRCAARVLLEVWDQPFHLFQLRYLEFCLDGQMYHSVVATTFAYPQCLSKSGSIT